MKPTKTKKAPVSKVKKNPEERILEAAQVAFMTHGYDGGTTDMIQVAASVSKSTLYRYFPTKQELFTAAFQAYNKDFISSVGQIYKDNDDVEAFLYQFGLEFLQSLISPRGLTLFRLMVSEGQRFPQVGKMFYIVGPKVTTDLVESYLANADLRGAVRVENPAMAAEHFIGMIRGDLYLRCLLGASLPPSTPQLERFVRITVTKFLAAYKA